MHRSSAYLQLACGTAFYILQLKCTKVNNDNNVLLLVTGSAK